jgi:hypothetical protein
MARAAGIQLAWAIVLPASARRAMLVNDFILTSYVLLGDATSTPFRVTKVRKLFKNESVWQPGCLIPGRQAGLHVDRPNGTILLSLLLLTDI